MEYKCALCSYNNRYKSNKRSCYFQQIVICAKIWRDARFYWLEGICEGPFVVTKQFHSPTRDIKELACPIDRVQSGDNATQFRTV